MIRQRQEVCAVESAPNTLMLLRNMRPILSRISDSYVRKYQMKRAEAYSLVFYYAWMGLKKYNPLKMKMTSYLTYYIMGSMKTHVKNIQREALNLQYDENQATGIEENLENRLLCQVYISEILSRVSEESRKILTDYFFLSSKGRGNGKYHRSEMSDSASRLNLSRFKFNNKLRQALAEARAVA